MTHLHSGCLDAAPSAREQAHAALARRAAAAGIVLLRNTGILPLDPAARVALLGAGAGHTVKGGIGSGDVNNRANVSIHAGLKAAGIALTSEDWLADYENRFRAAREAWKEKVLADAKQVENPFDAYSANPFVLPAGRPVTPRDTKGAVAALYVISRIAGEGKDRRLKKGDYYLSDAERSDLMALDRQGLPIVLLLNAGGPVELTGLLDEASHIEAILQISQLGQQGGEAVADVLLGKVTPEGKLTATWARHYEDYPDAGHFSYLDGDLEKAVYNEGIYVGYRWFDSFGVQPLFPFGYGLSYTSFSVTFEKLSVQPGAVQVSLTVQNNGICFAGRETAQVYLSCPQNGRARELRRLAGFAKTGLLAPGQSQTLAISIPQKQLASFDPQRQGWVVERGSYGVWVGSSSAHLQLGALLQVGQDTVIETTHPICPVQHPFEELGASPVLAAGGQSAGVPSYPFTPQPEPVPAVPEPPLAAGPRRNWSRCSTATSPRGASTLGSSGRRVPGSAGETSEALEKTRGIPSLIMADGPAGLRLRQSYQTDKASGAGVRGGRPQLAGKRLPRDARPSMRTPTPITSTAPPFRWGTAPGPDLGTSTCCGKWAAPSPARCGNSGWISGWRPA